MTSYRVRPRFKQLTQQTIQEVNQELETELGNTTNCAGQVMEHIIILKIPEKERHFWSPELSINLEETEEGTIIRGLYGPNPTVWTMFMFAYIGIGIMAMFALMVAITNIMLEKGYLFVFIFSGLCIAGLGLYLIAQFGQKMGVEQTFTLHHFFEETIHDKIHIT